MAGTRRYVVLGMSVIMIIAVFSLFSEGDSDSYDHTGIVIEVQKSTNGYVFRILTSDMEEFRCFSYDEPVELGYYAIAGSFSDDGNIFFVSHLRNLDTDPFR